MARSLSNVVNNYSKGIHHDNKKYETFRIKHKYSDCFLEFTNFTEDLIEYKSLCCNKN